MTLGNSANRVTIVKQREQSESRGLRQILTLEQTNNYKLLQIYIHIWGHTKLESSLWYIL